MTIREALDKRIPRIRKSAWSNVAYLRLPLLENGKEGPWAELYDRYGQQACGVKVGSDRLMIIGPQLEDDGYEEFTGEIAPEEKDNFAASYSEK